MDDPRRRPRYRGREVTDDDAIQAFLRGQAWGLFSASDDGPMATPLLYVYDEDDHAIDAHVSPAGRTAAVAAEGVDAAVAVATMGEIIHAWSATDFDVEYESVVAYGALTRLEDPSAKRAALERLMAKFAPDLRPGQDYRAITEAEVEATAVVRLGIEGWSAKRNRARAEDSTAPFDPSW